ncbi:polyamine-transporting ATPase 13A3-like isoform X2 [Tubulanus polymorphus]|uniref:polyamine-transporting ATPase 13A3-like isoform X2 n=1 Tax=Tubulanus polymorphus TaxID=672921 RepID=UPI003DA5A0F6
MDRRIDDNNSLMDGQLSQINLTTTTTLNPGTDEHLECKGYAENKCKRVLYYILVVLSCGILLLIMHWKPEWKLKLTKSLCPLVYADAVLLKDQYGTLQTEDIISVSEDGKRLPNSKDNLNSDSSYNDTTALLEEHTDQFLRYFDHHRVRYIWEDDLMTFKRLKGLDENMKCSSFYENCPGLTASVQEQKLLIYGGNRVDIEVKSYFWLFIQEVLNPFYIFQIFSVVLWALDNYYYYAGCIVFISAVSIGISLYETRKQSVTLRDMVKSPDESLLVSRGDGTFESTSTSRLVPGDVIIIPQQGCVMQCDAVLVAGNCIVNESMLTGESVPVTKTPLHHDEEIYNPDIHKRHTLFCGTHIIQTRYYGQSKVTAVVVRTGFSTAKGDLVRAILFPKPMDFKFYEDSLRFIGFLALIAACGMIYTTIILIRNGVTVYKVVMRALDIVTIAVPPALPAAMTVGTVYAQNRMKKQNIFCISPPRINVCGKLNVICFDKTGTLTEDGLDLWGVVPTESAEFSSVIMNISHMTRGPFLAAMATCHSLTMIDGELTGDPLDLKMFEATQWVFEEPGEEVTRFDSLVPTVVSPPGETLNIDSIDENNFQVLQEPGRDSSKYDMIAPTVVMPCTKDTFASEQIADDENQPPYEIGIVRQFTFTSALQRMSVITRTLGQGHMDLYAKGAPEKIASLCLKQTIPENFHNILQQYTMQGFRVIAVAWRPLDQKLSWHQAQRINRDQVECNLEFLGLIVMQNTLKPETTPIIQKLHRANIRTVMVTGDNMLTAVSVARDCSMIKPDERVVLVQAHPPEGDHTASIEWTDAESSLVDSDGESSDTGEKESKVYHAVNIGHDKSQRYHFAISGKCFSVIRQHFPEFIPRLSMRGTVFARMSPDQKATLIEELQDLNYCVGMCGDGANDCGALKMAHAGISLSEAEASVASPFTSKTPNIECIPIVIKEGRAALVTSFGVFKYMALYSMIQFITVIILYHFMTNLGDFQFLYIDLVITTTVAILMGHTAAYDKLVPERPKGSLLSPIVLISILGHITLQAAVQYIALRLLQHQPWYIRTPGNTQSEPVISWEVSLLFSISAFQYLIMAFVFSQGPPYRKPIWNNMAFLITLIVLTGTTAYLMVYPAKPIAQFFKLIFVSDDYLNFKLSLLGFPIINLLLALIFEDYVVNTKCMSRFIRWIRRKKSSKSKYKLVERELEELPNWPPVGERTYAEPNLPDDEFHSIQLERHSIN